MIAKSIIMHGHPIILICDGKCNKAWGVSNRPSVQLSDDENDFEYLSDGELGIAPVDPGTYEGGDCKPKDKQLNKWCARECERSTKIEDCKEFKLSDFTKRHANMHWRNRV